MYFLGDGRWAETEEHFRNAIDGFRVVGDRRHEIECICLLSTYRGDFTQRVGLGEDVSRLAAASGDLQAVAWGLMDQIESLLNLGDFDRAQEVGDELRAHLGRNILGADEIMAYGLLAALDLRRGDREAALVPAEKALEIMTKVTPTIVYNLEADAAVADVYLDAWEDASRSFGANVGEYREQARRAGASVRAFAKVFRIGESRALLAGARVAELEGDAARALRDSRRALEVAERMEMPYEAALAHRQVGRLLPTGDSGRGESLDRARGLFAEMKAAYDLRVVEAVAG
jgi:tetratricopeptide (TPR) repeat protein